jgi:FdhD protein
MTDPRPGPSTRVRVSVVEDKRVRARADVLATEEPMEIRIIGADGRRRTIAITMRTPGRDFELAAGFLFAEGVIAGRDDIVRIDYCNDPDLAEDERRNVVTVTLAGQIPPLPGLDRLFLTTSACGVCGKESLEALRIRGCGPAPAGPVVEPEVVCSLPDRLRAGQTVFAKTGGLHAAGLFTASGEPLAVREDVGRHNAVDKVVGWSLLDDKLPAHDRLLMVSGRTSYEIMQKAVVAGVPFVAAVSAPSSLAVALGRDFGVTLVGFVRGHRFNLYAGEQRIAAAPAESGPGSP